VADTFDAITSERPYRAAGSQKHALDILAAEAGVQLDANAVAAFQHDYSARRSVAWYAFAAAAVQRAATALQSVISNLGVGGASVAALAPALGAAGVLAVSPGLFRVSHAAQPSTGSLALLQPLHSSGEASVGAGGQTQARGGQPTGSRGVAPHVRAGLGPVAGHRRSARGGSPLAGAPATTAVGARENSGRSVGGQGGGSSSPEAPTSSPLPPVPGLPRVPAPSQVPPVTVPSVTTPSVGTPAITTPSVTTPTVSVPGATVPSVTIPPVTLRP
jgi:hypothetical protein